MVEFTTVQSDIWWEAEDMHGTDKYEVSEDISDDPFREENWRDWV